MTVDELARAAGMIVSTVRLYQNKGLLDPPTKRGRVGYYDQRHLQRLQLVAQLQERGFSLAAIKELLDALADGASLRGLLGMDAGLTAPAAAAAPKLTLDELANRLPGVELTPALLRRAADLGLTELSADETAVTLHNHRSFLRVGSELAALGVPADVILDEYEALRKQTDSMADRFTELFQTYIWAPLAGDEPPPANLTEIMAVLERLGPLAETVVLATLRDSLQTSAESFLRDEAERLHVELPPG